LKHETTYYDLKAPLLISLFWLQLTTITQIDGSLLMGSKQFDGIRIDWEIWQGQPEFGAISNYRYVTFVPRLTTASGTITFGIVLLLLLFLQIQIHF